MREFFINFPLKKAENSFRKLPVFYCLNRRLFSFDERNILSFRLHVDIGGTNDLARVLDLFDAVRAPPRESRKGKNSREQLVGQFQHPIDEARIKIDVGADAFIDPALFRNDFGR